MIIAFSGKKQSGKNTAGNFMVSIFMANLNIAENIHINDTGQIEVSDLLGNKCYKGIFDLNKLNSADYIHNKVHDMIAPHIKLYSFADILKKDVCMNILGLSYDQCYGDDNAKNTLTDINWQDMPGIKNNSTSYMTAREVMEYVGTNIFRSIKNNVWVDATIKKISSDKSKLAVITDCRFPNEIESVKATGGKVIRLTRSPFESNHISETVLDSDKYDWKNFDHIIDNSKMSIFDQCVEIEKLLIEVLSL